MTAPLEVWEMLVAPGPRARLGMTLDHSSHLVGSYAWSERMLFEVLGAWGADDPDEQCRLIWDAVSAQHAWHYEIWVRCLPVHDAVDSQKLVTTPGPEVELLFERLADETSTDVGISLRRLAVYGRVVLPRLLAGYQRHLHLTSPTVDGPVIRALELAITDGQRGLGVIELLTQASMGGTDTCSGVGRLVVDLESTVAALGPGLVSWPGSAPMAQGA